MVRLVKTAVATTAIAALVPNRSIDLAIRVLVEVVIVIVSGFLGCTG